jgi:protein-tyrosine phosphatase
MFRSILMVCVGNICRSPMAEALMAERARSRGVDVLVSSAGIAALVGRPAAPEAQDLMRARGLDISGHLARQLTPELLAAHELVLVMEEGHRRAVERMVPAARGRVRRLGHFGGFDVADPYLGPRAAFEQALVLIDRGVSDYAAHLWREPT